MEEKFIEKYKRYFEVWGYEAQATVCIEEMSELIKELCKFERVKHSGNSEKIEDVKEDIIEEIADVLNCVEQMQFYFGADLVNKERQKKMERTDKKLNEQLSKEKESQEKCEKENLEETDCKKRNESEQESCNSAPKTDEKEERKENNKKEENKHSESGEHESTKNCEANKESCENNKAKKENSENIDGGM